MGATFQFDDIYIVTEWLALGSLYDRLQEANGFEPKGTRKPNKRLLSPEQARQLQAVSSQVSILLDTARGVNYLHRCSPPLLHRDLKSLNLLLDQHLQCKICDFGLATVQQNDLSVVGSLYWTAPEVLRGEGATVASDTYSFGIVMWEVFSGAQLYSEIKDQSGGSDRPRITKRTQITTGVLDGSLRPQNTDRIPPAAWELMQRCWSHRAELRPDFNEILNELSVLPV